MISWPLAVLVNGVLYCVLDCGKNDIGDETSVALQFAQGMFHMISKMLVHGPSHAVCIDHRKTPILSCWLTNF